MVKTTEPSTAHPIVDPSGPGLDRLQPLPHVTPVNVDLLHAELASHPDRVFVSSLINDMSYGAKIGCTGPRSAFMAPNLASADEHAAAISAFLTKECTAGRMAGPFNAPPPPCKNLRCSGTGAVPKKSGGMRIIMHLSAPDELSVNDGINKDEFSLHYVTVVG